MYFFSPLQGNPFLLSTIYWQASILHKVCCFQWDKPPPPPILLANTCSQRVFTSCSQVLPNLNWPLPSLWCGRDLKLLKQFFFPSSIFNLNHNQSCTNRSVVGTAVYHTDTQLQGRTFVHWATRKIGWYEPKVQLLPRNCLYPKEGALLETNSFPSTTHMWCLIDLGVKNAKLLSSIHNSRIIWTLLKIWKLSKIRKSPPFIFYQNSLCRNTTSFKSVW